VSKCYIRLRETCTIDKMMTQGRFNDWTISIASDVLPDPELPATPIMLISAHGGE
jgi:hypothetical protein